MATDCDESANVRESNSKAGPPEARGPGDGITEIEEGLDHVLSSLLALAQEQRLSTVYRPLSRLKHDTEESLISGYSPIFCPTFPASARQTLSEFQFLLGLKMRLMRQPVEEVRAQSAVLEKYLAYTDWEFQDAQAVFKNEAARLAGVYAMRVSQFVEETSEQLSDEIREQFRLLEEAGRSERSDRISCFVQARLQELLGSWQSPFEESSMELFQHAAIRFARHACELITSIRSNTRSLFGCSVQDAECSDEFEESDCLTCIQDRSPDCFFNDTRFHFPVAHFRKHLLRNTLRNASSDLLSYASCAVEEHKGYLDKHCTDLIKRMTELLNETREGICNVVEVPLSKPKRQDKPVSAEHETDENRNAVDMFHRYVGELDLLLCRWESVGDTAREGRVNSQEPEASNAGQRDQ